MSDFSLTFPCNHFGIISGQPNIIYHTFFFVSIVQGSCLGYHKNNDYLQVIVEQDQREFRAAKISIEVMYGIHPYYNSSERYFSAIPCIYHSTGIYRLFRIKPKNYSIARILHIVLQESSVFLVNNCFSQRIVSDVFSSTHSVE